MTNIIDNLMALMGKLPKSGPISRYASIMQIHADTLAAIETVPDAIKTPVAQVILNLIRDSVDSFRGTAKTIGTGVMVTHASNVLSVIDTTLRNAQGLATDPATGDTDGPRLPPVKGVKNK